MHAQLIEILKSGNNELSNGDRCTTNSGGLDLSNAKSSLLENESNKTNTQKRVLETADQNSYVPKYKDSILATKPKGKSPDPNKNMIVNDSNKTAETRSFVNSDQQQDQLKM
jgi:hypothetical protein